MEKRWTCAGSGGPERHRGNHSSQERREAIKATDWTMVGSLRMWAKEGTGNEVNIKYGVRWERLAAFVGRVGR